LTTRGIVSPRVRLWHSADIRKRARDVWALPQKRTSPAPASTPVKCQKQTCKAPGWTLRRVPDRRGVNALLTAERFFNGDLTTLLKINLAPSGTTAGARKRA
jgi:hypothetical protein